MNINVEFKIRIEIINHYRLLLYCSANLRLVCYNTLSVVQYFVSTEFGESKFVMIFKSNRDSHDDPRKYCIITWLCYLISPIKFYHSVC